MLNRLDPYGLAGQWLTDALNASVYTYEVAPVFTLMETHIIQEICRMIGPEWGDGMFCPGGSTANGIAINLARYSYCPDIKVGIYFENCLSTGESGSTLLLENKLVSG